MSCRLWSSSLLSNLFPQMSPEQVGQLYELMLAAKGEMTEDEREAQIEATLTGMGVPTGKDGAQS